MELDFISHSQVSMALRCMKQYYFRYCMGMKVPPSGALHLGKSFAKSMERNFVQKQRSRTDLPIEEVLDYYGHVFDYGRVNEEIDWGKEDPGEVKDEGYLLVGGYMEQVAPGVQPIGVEEKEQRHVVSDELPPFYVVLDLIEEREFGIDHKTASKAWSENDEFKEIQHFPYMSYLGSKFGRPPWDCKFEYHVAARSRARKRETQLKALAAGKSLKDDLVDAVEIRPVWITKEGFEWYLDLVKNVVLQIRREIWTPRPTNKSLGGGYYCSADWCGYWPLCRGRTMPKSFAVPEEIELIPLGEA